MATAKDRLIVTDITLRAGLKESEEKATERELEEVLTPENSTTVVYEPWAGRRLGTLAWKLTELEFFEAKYISK